MEQAQWQQTGREIYPQSAPRPNPSQLAAATQATLERCGRALFAALFTDQVLTAWREHLLQARTHQQSACLRFSSTVPSIIAIPWEYLYDPEHYWLALHPEISFVRALPRPTQATLPVAGALHVAVMIASPTDLPPLKAEQEWAQLVAMADTANVELVRVEPTYAALQDALRETPHVFHFIGHGAFNEATEQGELAFCADDGRANLIAADKIALLLANHPTLRLVLLNACEGAETGTRSAFAGVAQRLIGREVPAVIAMQAPIYDTHAIRFSQEFYGALADGRCIEQAVVEGRKLIYEVAGSWGIPALYFQGTEPFRIPRLSNIDHAARRWQKIRQIAAAEVPERLRRQLAAVLKLDPTHVEASKRLKQLENEAEAARLYTEVADNMTTASTEQQWREIHRLLMQIERLAPGFRDTGLRLAQVLGKLGPLAPVAASADGCGRGKIQTRRKCAQSGASGPVFGLGRQPLWSPRRR
jgi:hypothetical protein